MLEMKTIEWSKGEIETFDSQEAQRYGAKLH